VIRTFIYGSCVSRDTFEFLPGSKYHLVKYIARQSLISSTSPAIEQPMPPPDTSSSFQRRMLTGDWTGSLFSELRDNAQDIDLVLWDICDERLGVYALPPSGISKGSAYCTRSVDSIRSGRDAALAGAKLITFGSARHRILFNTALVRFRSTLAELGLLDRCLLVGPPWALEDTKGRPTPDSFGLTPTRANRLFRDYYSIASRVVTKNFINVQASVAVADADHQWGVAPFHYTPETYAALAAQVETSALARA